MDDLHDGNCLCNKCTAGIGDTPEPHWLDEELAPDYYMDPPTVELENGEEIYL
ncbi:hypothetical protein UFRH6_49 [Pseudomonas phage UF_RH6]|nr:hypothetical protein UFRH6_49 [Pseudomonas phage UF_RH6]